MQIVLKKNRGFSLMELLVVVAVTALLMAGAFGLLSTSIRSYQNTMDQGANVQISRSIMNAVAEEIRNASAVAEPVFVSGTAQQSGYLVYTSPAAIVCKIAIGSGADAHNILVTNNNTGSIINNDAGIPKRYGQGRVSSLQFIRSESDKRVFTVKITLQDTINPGATATAVTTVVTVLNALP